MNARTILMLAATTVVAASPVAARSLKSVPMRLDPAKAYVLVELGQVQGAKAQGQIVLARYDREKSDVRGLGRSSGAPLPGNASPRETTGAALVKADARRLYLLEVEPDFWVVEGANGTAFSLGSAGVTLAPGVVTDLGVATIANDYADGDGPEKLTAGKLAKMALLGPFAGGGVKPKPVPAAATFRPRQTGDLPVPDGLRSLLTPASWSEPVKFGNHLGGLVNRLGGRKARVGPGASSTTAASDPGA
jgi:hypothetical protein